MVIAGLQRNINVLCEKPLCMDKKDIPRILDAERASSAQLGVCFQNRYLPVSLEVKKILETDKPTSAHGRVVWLRGKDYYSQDDWHGTKAKEGGGVLINQAIHTLDQLQWFVGMPKALSAFCGNMSLKDVIEVEDTASVYCFGDVDFSLLATNAGANGYPVEIVVNTENKRIEIRGNVLTVNGKAKDYTSEIPAYGKPCYGIGHWPLFADFYDCVKTGRKFPINGAEGAKAVVLVLSAYESKGEKIEL
jgi:predicted dehydrogenase